MWLLTWEDTDNEDVTVRELIFSKHRELYDYTNSHDIESYEAKRVDMYQEVS